MRVAEIMESAIGVDLCDEFFERRFRLIVVYLPVLAEVELKKLRHVLRDPRLVKSRLFHGESGRYAWVPPAKDV